MSAVYVAPTDRTELAEALAGAAPPITVIGGGTMVIPRITFGHEQPRTLLDLSRAGLDGGGVEDDRLTLGAMTNYTSLQRFAERRTVARLLAKVAHGVTGGPQIRHRGTIGGSACFANPGSDMPAVLAVLDTTMELVSPRGTRSVRWTEFFRGAFETCRDEDEVLVALSFPDVEAACGYLKFKLSQSSWPIVTAASVLTSDGALRVAVGGLAGVPLVLDLPVPVDGPDRNFEALVAARLAEPLAAVSGPWTDELAEGRYRERIAPVVVARSVADCLSENNVRERGVS